MSADIELSSLETDACDCTKSAAAAGNAHCGLCRSATCMSSGSSCSKTSSSVASVGTAPSDFISSSFCIKKCKLSRGPDPLGPNTTHGANSLSECSHTRQLCATVHAAARFCDFPAFLVLKAKFLERHQTFSRGNQEEQCKFVSLVCTCQPLRTV